MPFNLLKLTNYYYYYYYYYYYCSFTSTNGAGTGCSARLGGRSRTPAAAMCSSWRKTATTTTCTASPHDNNNNNNSNNGLGFRGHKNKAVAMGSVNGDDKLTSELKPLPANNKLLTLPTMLTIGRVFAIPVIVTTFYLNSRLGTTVTTCIFIAAAITDWLDGYLARKMNLGTAFGAFLDPVADKLMVATTLVLLCTKPPEAAMLGQWPWLLTVPSIAMIGREITMSAVREWAASQDSKLSGAVAVNSLGKWKTATQMTSLTILLAIRDLSFTKVGLLGASGVGLLYVSAGLAVWSLVVYMKKISKVLLLV